MGNKKRIIIQMFVIVFVAVVAALVYNAIRPDAVPFIQKSKEELTLNDDELLSAINTPTKVPSIVSDSVDTSGNKEDKVADTMQILIKPDTTQKPPAPMNATEIIKKSKKSASGEYKLVTLAQMKQLVENNLIGKFTLIDARRPENYAKAHIKTAVNIYYEDNEDLVIDKIMALSADKPVIVYCDGGNCELSHNIAMLLTSFGFKQIFIYEGGWDEWNKVK